MELENRDRHQASPENAGRGSDTDGKSSPEKTSKGLKTVVLVFLLIICVAVLAVGSFLLTKMVLLPRFQTMRIKKELSLESESTKKKSSLQPGIIYKIEDLTVNTYGSMGRRFVVAEYALETSEKSVINELKIRDHQIRDMLIKYLRNYTAEQILEMRFQENSRGELIYLINSRLSSGQVDSLYYITLVVQ